MKTCPICKWRLPLSHLQSSLGDCPICVECFHAKAENEVTIHRAVNSEGGIPEILIKGMSVWNGEDDGYMSLGAYYRRMRKQQLVVVFPEPERDIDTADDPWDEDVFHRLRERVLGIRKDSEFNASFPPSPEVKARRSIKKIFRQFMDSL